MPLVRLTADNLGDIHEGRARLLLRDLMKSMYEDIQQRGRDGKARTLTIDVNMTPDGDEVAFDLSAKVKLPAHRTAETRGVIKLGRQEGESASLGLFFRDDSDDVNQPTLQDGEIPNEE